MLRRLSFCLFLSLTLMNEYDYISELHRNLTPSISDITDMVPRSSLLVAKTPPRRSRSECSHDTEVSHTLSGANLSCMSIPLLCSNAGDERLRVNCDRR